MRNIALFILIFFVSCINQSYKDKKKSDVDSRALTNNIKVETDSTDDRSCIDFDLAVLSDSMQLKKYIIHLFFKDFEGVAPNDIQVNKLETLASIAGFGRTTIFEIRTVNDRLASIVNPLFYLFLNKEKQKAVLFPLSNLHLIKIKSNDFDYLVSGTFKIRSKGYYLIYDYRESNYFKCVLNTLNDGCSSGAPVYNNSLDCMSYKPFALEFNNTDLNGDGLLDLKFSGKALLFCEGLESGYGRDDRKPIKEMDLNIQFLTYQDQQGVHWVLKDSTICQMLNKY